MNYLQLAQAVKQESGMAGSGPTDVATTVQSERRIFSWVDWAARDIALQREDWRWRRGSATLASTTSMANAPAAFGLTDFASWKGANSKYWPTAYRISDGAATESKLTWLEYDEFRIKFMTGAQAPGLAQYWSVSPSEEFLIGPTPDSAHFIRADYVKDYAPLTQNTDTPPMPARFHMLIVWRALKEYGGYDAASEVYQRASENYQAMWPGLVQSQLEAPGFIARSLA